MVQVKEDTRDRTKFLRGLLGDIGLECGLEKVPDLTHTYLLCSEEVSSKELNNSPCTQYPVYPLPILHFMTSPHMTDFLLHICIVTNTESSEGLGNKVLVIKFISYNINQDFVFPVLKLDLQVYILLLNSVLIRD